MTRKKPSSPLPPTPVKAIRRAIEIAGSISHLARALGCQPNLISMWTSGKKDHRGYIPKPSPLKARRIEEVTKGEVKAAWVRPDIFA